MKKMSEKEGGTEKKKDSQCFQHSSDATANALHQQPHTLK